MAESKHVRMVIIEDHALVREILAKALAAQTDFEVVGAFPTTDEALQLVKEDPVDLVLLDINLGSEQGNSFLARARACGFNGKVLVVTAGVSEREAAWLLHRGYSGIFLKNDPPEVLFERIRDVISRPPETSVAAPQAAVSHVESRDPILRARLTEREREVLRFVCEGLSNKEIAQRMGITENTVKGFLRQLFDKAAVRSRAQLVRVAIERYWDQLESE